MGLTWFYFGLIFRLDTKYLCRPHETYQLGCLLRGLAKLPPKSKCLKLNPLPKLTRRPREYPSLAPPLEIKWSHGNVRTQLSSQKKQTHRAQALIENKSYQDHRKLSPLQRLKKLMDKPSQDNILSQEIEWRSNRRSRKQGKILKKEDCRVGNNTSPVA